MRLVRISTQATFAIFVGALLQFGSPVRCTAAEILVADRLGNAVEAYSTSGAFLGTVVTDSMTNTPLNAPDGIAISPDGTKLWVANSGNSTVVEFNYNAALGTASDPQVFAPAGLSGPSSMVFSSNGSTLYVSNNASPSVIALNANTGNPIGSPISGGSAISYSGLAYTSAGNLLVGGFLDSDFESGSVAMSDPSISSLTDIIAPSTTISGAAGLLVRGNDVYVTGLYAGTLAEYDLTTGMLVGSFGTGGVVGGLVFPQGLMAAPDGNGILVGILGDPEEDVPAEIDEYSYSGAFESVFATSQSSPSSGFVEPTAFVAVPEPSGFCLLGIGTLLGGAAFASQRPRRGLVAAPAPK